MACTLEGLVDSVNKYKNNEISDDQLRDVYLEFMKIDIESWITDDTTFEFFLERINHFHNETCTTCDGYYIRVTV